MEESIDPYASLYDKLLVPGGEMPFAGCELFAFATTRQPEGILRVDRDGGVLIACDALQHWPAPDEFFADDTRRIMQEMGFFHGANLGPVWMQINEPRAEDFAATCAAMANEAIEPDAQLLARLEQIQKGLGNPW